MAASTRSKKAKLWFSKSAFEGLDNDEDEDIELEQMMSTNKGQNDQKLAVGVDGEDNTRIVATNKSMRENGVKRVHFQDNADLVKSQESSSEQEASSDESESDDSSEEEEMLIAKAKAAAKKGTNSSSLRKEVVENGTFEVVPANKPILKLDPEGLAIGALMVQSKKKREDLIESGYNRWTHNDDNLPDWFVADEAKYCQKTLPVTKEMVEVYRSKLKEINSRPIKKIAEARARKKRHALKKLEGVRKKAEVITDLGDDVSVQEKAQQIKQLYKKVGVLGKRKRDVQYVVAKKGVGKRVKRPAGVKGHFKVVDPRMKKDARGKAAAKTKGQRSGGQKKRRKH